MRLCLTFAGTSAIPISATSVPAWGADTSLGWQKLPDNSIAAPQLGDTAFGSTLPVGTPGTPVAKVQFELVSLYSLGLTDVVAALKKPAIAASYAIPGGSSHTMTTDTTTLLTVLADNGDGDIDIEDFAVAYQGAQIKQVQRPLQISYADDTCYYEASFAHVVEACLERIKPVDIAQYALYNLNTATYVNPAGGSGDYAFAHLYDSIYQGGDDNATFAFGSATRAASIIEQFRCRLFAVEALPKAIEVLAQEVYRALVRDDSATLDFRRSIGTGSSSADGTMFDFLRFAMQTHDGSGDRGSTTLIVNNGGAKQLFFIGAGWQGGDTTYGVGDGTLGTALDDDDIVFGMFSPHDTQSGVYKYTNAYDLFVDMCAGGISKASYQLDDALTCSVYFSPLLGGIRSVQSVHRGDTVNEDPEAVLGAAYVASVNAQWPDPNGEDEGTVTRAATVGNRGDNEGGINLFFHNLPYAGSEGDFKYWKADQLPAETLPNIDDTGNYAFHSYAYFSPRRLYYFDDAATLLDGDSPILVHDQVQIQKNWGVYTDWIGTSRDRPTPSLFSGFHPFSSREDYYTQNLLRPYRARVFTLQRESCLAYAASDWLQTTFGSEDQWGISIRVDSNKANVSYIGERFQLKDDNDANASLDIFLQNGAFLGAAHYPSLAYCVAASEEDGFMKLSLLGIAAT